ncbi:hypothetical protein [Lacimicrobium sp. SS2-24]|uniref:hypothetical protein n=1 Tax=Lacimicrobium sp. SS2-24 TaxID=2005569 RepID=UPI000B4BBBF9|nr:hypothetical protein [Lacimicrobium sp. SS2-24]
MLSNLKQFSVRFYWLRSVTLVVGSLSSALFLYGLFCSACLLGADQLLIPAGVAALWAGVGYWFVTAFANVPDKPDKQMGFFKKVSIRFQRGIYLLFAILGCFLSLAVVFFTLRGLRIWIAG